jgi:hypothetical protein
LWQGTDAEYIEEPVALVFGFSYPVVTWYGQ